MCGGASETKLSGNGISSISLAEAQEFAELRSLHIGGRGSVVWHTVIIQRRALSRATQGCGTGKFCSNINRALGAQTEKGSYAASPPTPTPPLPPTPPAQHIQGRHLQHHSGRTTFFGQQRKERARLAGKGTCLCHTLNKRQCPHVTV